MNETTTTRQVGFEQILSGAWSEQVLEDSLRVVAEGVCEIAGFGVAALSVRREDGRFQVVAVCGDSDAESTLLGKSRERSEIDKDLADSVEWGSLRFVPHEAVVGREEDLGWVPDYQPVDRPDAWRPLDMLFAPLLDDGGDILGFLSVDLPVDGVRPDAAKQALLRRYVDVSSRVVGALVDRDHAAVQFRLANASRRIMRVASGQQSLDQLVAATQDEIRTSFGADGMWLQAWDDYGHGPNTIYSTDDREVVLPEAVIDVAHSTARIAWIARRVVLVDHSQPASDLLDEQSRSAALAYLDSIDVSSTLLVPLGAGEECLGLMVLTRNPGSPPWSLTETDWSREVGRDLGTAVFNARTFERERRLLEETRALDSYKNQLMSTITHEFRAPLTGILGYLELVEDSDVDAETRRALNVVQRNARRLERLVVDLLLLSRVADPSRAVATAPVDLTRLVHDAVDTMSLESARRNLKVDVLGPDQAFAVGDAVELARICTNLVSNAVKYSRDGGNVTISLAGASDTVTLTVHDDGLGIAEEEQEQLFGEFFRSANPEANQQPGTGLGLSIVHRIVQRHGGTITVDSTLGTGSTFIVTLPGCPAQG